MTKPKAVSAASARAARTRAGSSARDTPPADQANAAEPGQIRAHWRSKFLQKLAETSNVTLSAGHAGIVPSRAYKTRRKERDFDRAWRDALYEGYQHLEMEVLGYLRGTDADRKLDVANAIRVLKAHSETIAQERALQDNRDEREVLESIDAMIDQMRNRSLANAAIMAEPDPVDDEQG